MAERPVILTSIRHYLPGYKFGGPIRTLANMVEAVGDEFDFRIVTSDRDMLDEATYPGITPDTWCSVGKAKVLYMSPAGNAILKWLRLIRTTPHDLLYTNSLFAPDYSILPILLQEFVSKGKVPIIVSPRGELSPAALSIKTWKKAPFLSAAKLIGFYDNVTWHASTEDEARLIRDQIGADATCVVACDLTPPMKTSFVPQNRLDGDPLKVVFLSRISRVKNLDFALRILMRTQVRLDFDIWGPLEDTAYWADCLKLMAQLPENVRARYSGVASQDQVQDLFGQYDLFLFPTQGENFGHVIAEALSAGTTVITSDQTPWRGLEAREVGWDLPLDETDSRFTDAIEQIAKRSAADLSRHRQIAKDYAIEVLTDSRLIGATRNLFATALKSNRC